MQELKEFGYRYQEDKENMPQFIWRETSVQHFDTPLGTNALLLTQTTSQALTGREYGSISAIMAVDIGTANCQIAP